MIAVCPLPIPVVIGIQMVIAVAQLTTQIEMSLEHSELQLLAVSAEHWPVLNLVALEHLMAAFHVDIQMPAK